MVEGVNFQQGKLRVWAEHNIFNASLDLYILMDDSGGHATHVAKPMDLIMEPITEGGRIAQPTLRLRHYEAKDFLEAIKAGLERSLHVQADSEAGLAGELKATKEHLDDLRKVIVKAGRM